MTWNEYFLNIAEAVKLKSKDQRTQIGAVNLTEWTAESAGCLEISEPIDGWGTGHGILSWYKWRGQTDDFRDGYFDRGTLRYAQELLATNVVFQRLGL